MSNNASVKQETRVFAPPAAFVKGAAISGMAAYEALRAEATQVVFEGIPTFPNAGRFWETLRLADLATTRS